MPLKKLIDRDVDVTRFSFTEEDSTYFKERIVEIESYVNKAANNENFQTLCNIFYDLIDRIPMPLEYIDIDFLVRARPNYNGEIFNEVADISYNSKCPWKTAASRFNRPGESMFYAALKGENIKGDFIPTVSLECCKELVDENNTNRIQYLTFGKWKVRQPFYVINLCYNEEVLKNNPLLKNKVNEYESYLSEIFPETTVRALTHYWKFLSNVSCERHPNNSHYFISTAYFCVASEYFKRYENTYINGVLYPSCMTENNGLNIVLTPKAVDECLMLEEVFMYKYTRDPNNLKSFHSAICSSIVKPENDKYYFTALW